MKKVWLYLLAVLLIAVSITAVTVQAESASGVCPNCNIQQEDWKEINKNSFPITEGGHYYMAGSYVLGSYSVASGQTVCVDLNGYTYTANKNVTVQSGGTMHVWGGTIKTRGNSTKSNGGAFTVKNGGTLHLEDVKFVWDTDYGRNVPNGGHLYIDGTVNMKNTTLTGGVSTGIGGNVFISNVGKLTMDGGSIIGGTAPTGPCVYTSGTVKLAGNASVDGIVIVPNGDTGPYMGQILQLESDFKGSAMLEPYNVTTAGVDVGDVETGAVVSGLSLPAGDLRLRVEGTNLIAYLPGNADIMSKDNVVKSCGSLTEALGEVADGQHIILNQDVSEPVTVTKDVVLDLNGYDVEQVTVNPGATLSVMDDKTDDWDVEDGDYGRIRNYTGQPDQLVGYSESEHIRYLRCQDGEGISFHKLQVQVTDVSLRPTVAGVYYTSAFKGDGVIKEQVENFGVSLSLDLADMEAGVMKPGTYSTIDAESFNSDASATSTMLVNIMREDQNALKNRTNAATQIYGRPYLRLKDGTVLWGEIKQMSLQQFVEKVADPESGMLDTMSSGQKSALMSMYMRFSSVVRKWNYAQNLQNTYKDEETNTLKVLTIGNSHSNDSNWLLQQVFQSVNTDPNQKLVVGIMYKNGCSMKEHVDFALNDKASYTYYKNVDGSWVGTTSTLGQALRDQMWDVVILQEMNVGAGQASYFENDNVQTLIDYIKANSLKEPKFGWNLIWANPVTEIYWDTETRKTPGAPEISWATTYEKAYGTDQMTMYKGIVKQVEDYILTNENFTESLVIPSGTAVQYAKNVLGLTDIDLFRDYTHISEMSRLMMGYLWYAKLFGIEEYTAEDLTVTTVPAKLRQTRFAAEGDLTITDEFNEVILPAVNHALANGYSVPEAEKKAHPSDDGELNVLMIGNSFSHYFPDELKAMADADGKQITIYNAYKSGCTLAEHWKFLKNNEARYDLRINGAEATAENTDVTIWHCLEQKNWDVISLQEGSSSVRTAASGQNAWESSRSDFAHMYAMLKQRFPYTQIVWHQTWAYQQGTTTQPTPTVTDAAAQLAQHQKNKDMAQLLIAKYPEVDLVNSGDAWAEIRENGYDNLCARLGKNAAGAAADTGDNYHDGDIGGGQYLNACVWYEYLFGLDVRENTFVPTYYRAAGATGTGTLKTDGSGNYNLLFDREKLQDAAHAVSSRWVSPSNDDEFNVLFIGDSASYYWTDELYGMLTSAGYKNVRVCNAYYSTELKNIWTYLQNDTAKFTLFTVDENGRNGQENVTLKYAIDAQKWDCISFHQGKSAMSMADKAVALANTEPYLTNLLAYAKSVHPEADYYWDENWVPEIGYSNSTYTMESKEQQAQMLETIRYVAQEVSKKHGLTVIPNGDAWTPVRDLPLFTTPVAGTGVEKFTLCSRITAAGAFKDDLGHDGDIGGGQYLNACVAFEVLTGTSCLPSTYRPAYTLKGIDCSLTQEKIDLLKNAAHEAVTNWN